MIPFRFGPAGRQLYGAFHKPDTRIANASAVLLCNPFGQEAVRVHRLYRVLDTQLASQQAGGKQFVAGDYSIADMACYPWIVPHKRQLQQLEDFPNLARWFETIRARPAVQRAYALAQSINVKPTVDDEAKKLLFGQTAAVVK